MLLANPCLNDARVIKEAESLAAHGFVVRVLCLAEPGLEPFDRRHGVTYERVQLPQRRLTEFARTLRGAELASREPVVEQARAPGLLGRLKATAGPFLEHEWLSMALVGPAARFRPDVVHAHDFNTLPAALRVAARTGASIVYDMHEMEEGRLPLPGPILARLKNGIERRAMSRIAAAITVSPSIAAHYARKHGIERPALVLNAPRFERGRILAETVRERAGLAGDVPLAVYVGVMAQGRGNAHILEAIAIAQEFHLAVVGPVRPGMVLQLEALRNRPGLNQRIHLLGSVPHEDVVPFIRSADVGVCTIESTCLNYEYCLPNKLFEMTFAGLPLVVSRNVELDRFVRQAGNGIAVAATDPKAIADGLRHVHAERARYVPDHERLAGLVASFDWEAQERTLLGVYHRLLAGRDAGRREAA